MKKEYNLIYKILAIDELSFQEFMAVEESLYEKIKATSAVEMQAFERAESEREQSHLLQMQGDVAVISIKGMLTNSYSPWNRYFGRVAYDEIREAFIQANDLGAKAVLTLYDSPGGNVEGMADTAATIDSLDMFVVAHTDSKMCSAAYFLASQSDNLYCGDMADVGSIGVIAKSYDISARLKELKITPIRWRSGKFKGSGDGDFKLSAEEHALIQDRVDKTAAKFFDIVSASRGMPVSTLEALDITTGRTFMGEEALQVNLVDGIKTFDESMQEVHNYVKKIDKFN